MKRFLLAVLSIGAALIAVPHGQMRVVPLDDEQGHVALGLGLRQQPVAQLARDAQPWLICSLMVMLTTGILLFLAEAIKCYYSPAFAVKMTSLLLAITFTFTVRRKVALADESRVSPLSSRLVAVVSVALWSGVGIAGRWIGFS